LSIVFKASGQVCGAEVRGVDLRRPLGAAEIADIRSAWAKHHVLSFPDQDLSDDDLERFTSCFGALGDDPYFRPVAGRRYVAAIERRADETTSIFAESWHSDWSFCAAPPIGTCLYGKTIPPVGGDTYFADQQAAYAALPAERQRALDALNVVHSAVAAYAPEGIYGQEDASVRSMQPIISEDARARMVHPLVHTNPDNGQKAIYGCWGYSIGVDGMAQDEGMALLTELLAWQTRPEFIYTHTWQPGMLVMWDNRSLLHRASGGYDGHDRLLHRTTIWPLADALV
jgi:taurine dioxygenase